MDVKCRCSKKFNNLAVFMSDRTRAGSHPDLTAVLLLFLLQLQAASEVL